MTTIDALTKFRKLYQASETQKAVDKAAKQSGETPRTVSGKEIKEFQAQRPINNGPDPVTEALNRFHLWRGMLRNVDEQGRVAPSTQETRNWMLQSLGDRKPLTAEECETLETMLIQDEHVTAKQAAQVMNLARAGKPPVALHLLAIQMQSRLIT